MVVEVVILCDFAEKPRMKPTAMRMSCYAAATTERVNGHGVSSLISSNGGELAGSAALSREVASAHHTCNEKLVRHRGRIYRKVEWTLPVGASEVQRRFSAKAMKELLRPIPRML